MNNEPVPVKTKYFDRPPQAEPLWVHLDWIQCTAAILAQYWAGLAERRESWAKLRRAGAHDPVIRRELEQWQKLSEEVLPLFAETVAYVPREIWGSFEHIRTLYNAGKSPTLAVDEWKKLRDCCLKQLAKPAEQSNGGGGADNSKIRERNFTYKELREMTGYDSTAGLYPHFERAKVKQPTRGDGKHKFTKTEVRKVLQAVIARGSDYNRTEATKSLAKLDGQTEI